MYNPFKRGGQMSEAIGFRTAAARVARLFRASQVEPFDARRFSAAGVMVASRTVYLVPDKGAVVIIAQCPSEAVALWMADRIERGW